MEMMTIERELTDYGRIAAAIEYVEQHTQQQPGLKEIADHVGLSEYHFQRLFTRWAGISPKRFLQFLTVQHAKQLLSASHSVLDATYDSGLSSPGRLHDLFINLEAMTPGEYKRQGAGLVIRYGFHESPFGEFLLAMTERGICNLLFVYEYTHEEIVAAMTAEWAQAELVKDTAVTTPIAARIFNNSAEPADMPLTLLVKGTNFQVSVWRALLQLEAGTAVSYGTIAKMIGNPQAVRAIGTAVGSNPIAYLIPCHRVIRQVGGFGQYRWGSTRKKAILGWESARAAQH
jgi:AraC family transcriptional regulator, regulatory protein of adaptative response / methylated-DNA-[protein]-cysteine methyltransferase